MTLAMPRLLVAAVHVYHLVIARLSATAPNPTGYRKARR